MTLVPSLRILAISAARGRTRSAGLVRAAGGDRGFRLPSAVAPALSPFLVDLRGGGEGWAGMTHGPFSPRAIPARSRVMGLRMLFLYVFGQHIPADGPCLSLLTSCRPWCSSPKAPRSAGSDDWDAVAAPPAHLLFEHPPSCSRCCPTSCSSRPPFSSNAWATITSSRSFHRSAALGRVLLPLKSRAGRGAWACFYTFVLSPLASYFKHPATTTGPRSRLPVARGPLGVARPLTTRASISS